MCIRINYPIKKVNVCFLTIWRVHFEIDVKFDIWNPIHVYTLHLFSMKQHLYELYELYEIIWTFLFRLNFKNSRALWNFYCSPVNAFIESKFVFIPTDIMCRYYLSIYTFSALTWDLPADLNADC